MDDDNQERQVDVPRYRINHSEMPTQTLEKVVVMAGKSISTHKLEKEACQDLIKKLNEDKELENLGQGQWQCFIGKHLSASVSFDTGVLVFFDLLEQNKSVLVFKS